MSWIGEAAWGGEEDGEGGGVGGGRGRGRGVDCRRGCGRLMAYGFTERLRVDWRIKQME